jgi:hypothetical protein
LTRSASEDSAALFRRRYGLAASLLILEYAAPDGAWNIIIDWLLQIFSPLTGLG